MRLQPWAVPPSTGGAPTPRERFALRLALLVALASVCTFALTGPLRGAGAFVRTNAIDFVAVYCGTAVAVAGGDPYRVEPLRACEHAVVPQRGSRDAWVVVPAPLPSYTFALLRPFAALPFNVAKAAWVGATLLALLITSWCAARVCGLPVIGVLAVFLPALGLLNLHFGEPIPFAVALIGISALCARRGREPAAGALAALALLEPHVGLGACAGAFIGLPRARRAILVTGAVLAALGLAQLGYARNVEYLSAVLPAQARSELGVNYQLSLAHVLSLAGAGAKPALTAGALSYALTIALGSAAGYAFARRGARAAAVYLPVTFTMLGGAYIHTPEVAAALPGALLLCTLVSGVPRIAAAGGLALLVVPWNAASGDGIVSGVSFGLAAVFVALVLVRGRDAAPLAAAAAGTLALAAWIALLPPASAATHVRPADPAAIHAGALASADWAMFVDATHRLHDEDPRHILLKVPQWLGLLLVGGAALAGRPRPTARN